MTKEAPLTSIGISVYGQPLDWLQICIESALNQTNTNIEVLVRPDGPNAIGHTEAAWLSNIASRDRRLRLLEGPRTLGTFGSLRVIFQQARGDFLVQLDADDALHPQAIELACAEFEARTGLSMVYTKCLEMDSVGNIIGEGARQNVPYGDLSILVQFMTFHMRFICRRHYELVGGYRPDLKFTGDYDLSIRLSEVGGVFFLPLPLYNYRLHSNNTSRQHYQETVQESYNVARNALFRRRLAGTYYLRMASNNTGVLLKFPSWARKNQHHSGDHIYLSSTCTQWL